jgi:hypothetical protein
LATLPLTTADIEFFQQQHKKQSKPQQQMVEITSKTQNDLMHDQPQPSLVNDISGKGAAI